MKIVNIAETMGWVLMLKMKANFEKILSRVTVKCSSDSLLLIGIFIQLLSLIIRYTSNILVVFTYMFLHVLTLGS